MQKALLDKALLDMRRKLITKKGSNIHNPEVIIPLLFECEENIIEWAGNGFQTHDPEVVCTNNPDVQVL